MVSQRLRDSLKALANAMRNESGADFVRVQIKPDGSIVVWAGRGDAGDGKGQFGIIDEQKK